MPDHPTPQEALKTLGFSEIEAKVYCFLLQESPATGYRVAKGIGKAAANVYSAIEVLAQKGAVYIDDSERRLCRAVPADELLAALNTRFAKELGAAKKSLATLNASKPDQRIYRLETVDQVYARVEKIIASAKHCILADIFPGPLREISSPLTASANSGVTVGLETYGTNNVTIPDALVVNSEYNIERKDIWPGLQMNVVVDAREYVLALFDHTGSHVLHAVGTTSAYLSCLQHSYMAASMLAREYASTNLKMNTRLKRLKNLALTNTKPPGLDDFAQDYASAE